MIFGTRNFGAVHQVPGHFHVATQFFHLNFLPIFPLQSVVVLEKSLHGGEAVSVKYPWSVKSVVVGWLRAAALIGAIIFAISSLEEVPEARNNFNPNWISLVGRVGSAVALIFVWWRSYHWTRADESMAMRVCEVAEFPEAFRFKVANYFGIATSTGSLDENTQASGKSDNHSVFTID